MAYFRFLIVFVIALFLFGNCKKEEFAEENDGMWIPQLSGQRMKNSVLLDWYKPRFYPMNIIPPHFVNPDFTDIYFSLSMESGFKKIKTVKGEITSIAIENLSNGIAHYFYVVLRKKGFDNLESGKIMIIPSEEEIINHIYEDKRNTLGLGAVKNGISEIAFTNWNFKWSEAGKDFIEAAVLIYMVSENKISVLDTFSYSPVWSPDGNSLIYVTNKKEIAVDGHRPSHLVVYQLMEKRFLHFPDGNNEIRYPDWKDAGESVVYVKNPGTSGTEIWEMKLETGTKTRLVQNNPFSDNTLLNPDKPDVSPDNKYVFFDAAHSTDHGGPLSIWKYSFQTKTQELVFQTEWDDSNPAVSPSGEKLAFVSNRSGEENIWIYDLKNKKFSQITGTKQFYIRKGLGRITWVDDNTIAFAGSVDEWEGILTVSVR